MKEEFKKWINVLLYDENEDDELVNIAYYIKAMWAINREGKYQIVMDEIGIEIFNEKDTDDVILLSILFKDHNSSEIEALTKALEYIHEQEKKENERN